MSFVITTVSPEAVVQVSDTRLSDLADKSVLSEELRKTVVFIGTQVRFVLGWVGLATVGSHDTGFWISKQLYEMNAVDLPLDQIADYLARLATRDFATLPVSPENRRCHFYLGGWHTNSETPKPFMCIIYNDQIFHPATGHIGAKFESARVAAPEFSYSPGSLANVKRAHSIFGSGDCTPEKLQVHTKRMRELMKKRADAKSISAACRRIILEAASHSETINRNLICVEMDSRGGVHCSYHPENGAEVMLLPDLVTAKGILFNPTLAVTGVAGDDVTLRLRGKIAKPDAGA